MAVKSEAKTNKGTTGDINTGNKKSSKKTDDRQQASTAAKTSTAKETAIEQSKKHVNDDIQTGNPPAKRIRNTNVRFPN